MTVPFLDVAAAHRELRPQLDAAYTRVMDRGWFVLGAEVEAFEREFAAACGAAHAVGVGNGLDALEIGLRAAGVGPGSEVVVPAFTFIATWLAVERCGAAIVPVDVRPDTLNIDVAAVEAALTGRTAAIVAVDLYGRPAELDALSALAAGAGALLLEDAAQAHGAARGGRPVGVLAPITTFSFYPAKNLGALGDGGALTTSDDGIAERARRLRNYGSASKYDHADIGFNSRLDELQAAFLRVKLAALGRWNARRREIAAAYERELADVPGLTLPPPDHESAWHVYCVRHLQRDALQAHLSACGVETLIHYPVACHRSGAFARGGWGSFPVAEEAARSVLSLPIGPHLGDDGVARVVRAVREFRA